MDILTHEQLVARLDFRRPLPHLPPAPEPADSAWPIPFEWGDNAKGTTISVAKAKEIAAELRREVAEYEKRMLRRALDDEKSHRNQEAAARQALRDQVSQLQGEVAELKRTLRRRAKRGAR